MAHVRELLNLCEEKAKWEFNHDGDGYILNNANGSELGAVIADNPGSWHAYEPESEHPIAGPFDNAIEAAMAVEDAVGVEADRSELPGEDDDQEDDEDEAANAESEPLFQLDATKTKDGKNLGGLRAHKEKTSTGEDMIVFDQYSGNMGPSLMGSQIDDLIALLQKAKEKF